MSRLVSALGAAGSVAAALAALGCCGTALLAPAGAAATVGAALGALASGWAYEALYAALGLTLLGLAAGARRHGCRWPLVGALLGAGALLAALHAAWDVTVFAGLVTAGFGLLLSAVVLGWRSTARRAGPGQRDQAACGGAACAT